MKRVVKAALLLQGLSVPQRIEKARSIVATMTGNPNFPTPVPALATITAAALALETAYIASRNGDRGLLATMRQKELVLRRLMTAITSHVEYIANQNPDNSEAIITGAGVNVKNRKAAPITEFRAVNTDIPGEVLLRTKSLPRASFKWEYAPAEDAVPAWVDNATTIQASVYVNGLISAKKYKFRVATVTKDGQGPWSNELTLLVA